MLHRNFLSHIKNGTRRGSNMRLEKICSQNFYNLQDSDKQIKEDVMGGAPRCMRRKTNARCGGRKRRKKARLRPRHGRGD